MISTRFITLLALAASLPLTESAPLDVWVPQITYPYSGIIWTTGVTYPVTWDVSNPPASITNPIATIYLVKDSIIQYQYPLASNFNLLAGQVEIQVPNVDSGTYQILLYGDSGDDSPSFTITNPSQ